MIGHRPPPTSSKSQRYGSGFQGSPVVTIVRSDERSVCRLAVRDQRARERGGDAEHGDPLRLDQLPEAVRRPVGRALGEDERRAHRVPADDGPGAHDPAHVGHEVDAVVRPRVGLVADLARDRDEEAALDVDDALRRAGRPGRVREQVRRLGVELRRWQLTRRVGDELVPGRDDDVLDARRLAARLLEDLEHRHLAPATARRCARVIATFASEAWSRCATAGAAKPEKIGTWIAPMCAQACDAIGTSGDIGRKIATRSPSRDAELDERLGEPRHLARELGERLLAPRPVLAEPDRGDRVRPPLGPAVHAVPGDVHLAADEPRRPLRPAREVDDRVPGPRELEAHVLDRRRPEPLGVLLRAARRAPSSRRTPCLRMSRTTFARSSVAASGSQTNFDAAFTIVW